MRWKPAIIAYALLVLGCLPGVAGILGPGKYSGVVIFDRWDACYLYSGIFLMYVSEKVKEGLRPYAGQAIQINATDVYQPMNPGDGLIRAFTVLGAAPPSDVLGPLTGLELHVDMRVADAKPEFRIRVRNNSDEALTIYSNQLAPTMLARVPQEQSPFSIGDGASEAVLTHWDLMNGPPYTGALGRKLIYGQITSGPVPASTELLPRQEMVITMLFDVPPGEFEFLCGYGGHWTKCVASNLVPFDVDANRHLDAVSTMPPPSGPAPAARSGTLGLLSVAVILATVSGALLVALVVRFLILQAGRRERTMGDGQKQQWPRN